MTFNKVVWKMAKYHYKKYLFYLACNSLAILFFFMFMTVYFNEQLVALKEIEGIQSLLAIPGAALIVFTVFFISLAVQGCEHINRALAVEREVAQAHGWEIVKVVPALHAGGAAQIAAFEQLKDPVEIEHITAQAGMDIGDTAIGMHVKFVQVPVRTKIAAIGAAHTTYLRSRPKLIGGQRAQYEWRDQDD